jgi:hypothetical protein
MPPDDSGSMQKDNRVVAQRELVRRITEICTILVPADRGIELRFINADRPVLSKLRADHVKAIMAEVSPDGWTEIGLNLKKKILQPLIYDKIDKREKFERPMLISIITDGSPGGEPGRSNEREDTLKQAILECGDKLRNSGYEPECELTIFLTWIGH